MAEIVGVKFNYSNKTYYFGPNGIQFEVGDQAIVETAKGVECGKVTIKNKEVPDELIVQPLKNVIRKADAKDLKKQEEHSKKISWIIETTIKEVKKLNLEMKVITAEIPIDGSKVIIYFSSENRVDFRDLVKNLAAIIHQRIDLRQIGSKDEAKMIGGLAPCGRVCCCHEFLPEYKNVSMKMAKNQGLSLNPLKISGLCGKLMCCLEYENEPYAEAFKLMPKLGGEVETPDGKGIVVSNNILKKISKVKIAQKDGTMIYNDYNVEDLKFKSKVKEEKETEEEDKKED